MAITSELLGKLGGADVESSEISLEGAKGITNIRTVTVPSGATILVVLVGEFEIGVPSHEDTYVSIGGIKLGKPANKAKYLSVAKVLTSTEDIELRNDRYEANPFTGTLYLVEM